MIIGSADADNYILQGDNLTVLAGLQERYAKSVKCVYIDPPYNNQEIYAHYLDGQDHEVWLTGLEARLRLMWPLLRDDGSLWISIDDREAHYLKVLCDRLFGRDHFVATIVWNHRKSRENRRTFSNNHEYILVYAVSPDLFSASRNDLPLTLDVLDRYRNPDEDPRGAWQSVSLNVQAGHAVPSQFYEVIGPTGRVHKPPRGRCWAFSEERMLREINEGNIWFGRDGNAAPRLKKYLRDVAKGLTPETLWTADQVGTTVDAKKHTLSLFPEAHPFDTPKPERLIARILQIATNPGDLVLDAYLGSGTTAAVAHKMHRRYLGIESGDHAATLCLTRIQKVIDGEAGGVSSQVGWTGGGGCVFQVWQAPKSTLNEVTF
jgi:adenine-specific DNA-methyltransferase